MPVCPADCLEMAGPLPWLPRPADCVSCALCVLICPVGALELAPLEVEEARASAFMAICELGKALHRGQPADGLWAPAISATERWKSLAR